MTRGYLFDSEGHLFEIKNKKVIYLTERDIYLTGRDIYFEKGPNFVTDYLGDEILIMFTIPMSAFPLGPVHIVKKRTQIFDPLAK